MWLRTAVFLALAGNLSVAVSADNPASQILYQEAVDLVTPGETSTLSFFAFGQRFDIALVANTRLERRRTVPGIGLYRGTVNGRAGSWARITRRGDELRGIVFDGEEQFGIEPRESARPRMLHPDGGTTTNIIFRMSDLVLPADASGCALLTAGESVTGEQALAGLALELNQPIRLNADSPLDLNVDVIADFEFFSTYGAGSEAELMSRINMVDGIFAAQLGVDINIREMTIFNTAGDPFQASDAEMLLDEVSNFRLARGIQYGPTHLLTGRDLDGTTRGIAFLGAACSDAFGVAISQQVADPWISALTTAHEIGHNLGAFHDNEGSPDPDGRIPNPCEFAPPGFLMENTITGTDQFSQCSLDTMERFLARPAAAACISGVVQANTSTQQTSDDKGSSAVSFFSLSLLLILALRRRPAGNTI